jgi:hypothetical protein
MNPLKIIIIVFISFAISRVILRIRSHELSPWSAVIWLLIWSGIIILTLLENVSTQLASWIGIGRGVDLAFFLAIIILFYLLFRIYIKLDRVDRDITDVVIKISLPKKEPNPPKIDLP